MWFRLMDEQEVCGLGVDVCACAERMGKSLTRRLSLFFFFQFVKSQSVCVCVSVTVPSYFDAGSCRLMRNQTVNVATTHCSGRDDTLFPLSDNSPAKVS